MGLLDVLRNSALNRNSILGNLKSAAQLISGNVPAKQEVEAPLDQDLSDFIRGEFPDPESRNFTDYTLHAQELARAYTLGDTEMEGIVEKRWEQIEAQFKDNPKELQRIKDLFNGYVAEAIDQVSDNETGSKKAQIQKALNTANAFAAIKAGSGLVQVLHGAFKAKGLEAPKIPETLKSSNELASQITKSIYRSEQGDPKFRSYYESKIAEANEIDNFRAKVSGDLGQFAANIQGNAIQRARAERGIAVEETKEKARNRAETQRLLSLDLEEKKAIQNDKFRRFGAQERRFQSDKRDLTNQIGSGITNIFSGLNNMAENEIVGGLFGTDVKKSTGVPTGTKGFQAIQPPEKFDDIGSGGDMLGFLDRDSFRPIPLGGEIDEGVGSLGGGVKSTIDPNIEPLLSIFGSKSSQVRGNTELLSAVRRGIDGVNINGRTISDPDDGRPFDEKTLENINFLNNKF